MASVQPEPSNALLILARKPYGALRAQLQCSYLPRSTQTTHIVLLTAKSLSHRPPSSMQLDLIFINLRSPSASWSKTCDLVKFLGVASWTLYINRMSFYYLFFVCVWHAVQPNSKKNTFFFFFFHIGRKGNIAHTVDHPAMDLWSSGLCILDTTALARDGRLQYA